MGEGTVQENKIVSAPDAPIDFLENLRGKLVDSLLHGLNVIILGDLNCDVLKRLDIRNVKRDRLIRLIQQRQLHFLRHILRKPEDELVNKYALFYPRHGKRKIGRPKLMFNQYIASVISEAHPPLPD